MSHCVYLVCVMYAACAAASSESLRLSGPYLIIPASPTLRYTLLPACSTLYVA